MEKKLKIQTCKQLLSRLPVDTRGEYLNKDEIKANVNSSIPNQNFSSSHYHNEGSYPDQIFGFLYQLCMYSFFSYILYIFLVWISGEFSAWNGRKVHGIGLEEHLLLMVEAKQKQLFAFWMMMSRGYTSSCFLCVSLPAQSILASQAAADLKGNILWTSRPSQASLWNSSAKSSCTNVATLMGKNSKSYEGYQAYANLLWPSIQLQLQNWPVMVVL